jgi:hypothetical protein
MVRPSFVCVPVLESSRLDGVAAAAMLAFARSLAPD